MVVCAGDHAAIFEPSFDGSVAAQQVHGNVPEDGEVLRGILDAHAALVFAERHVQGPMHAVLDDPMRSDGVGNAGGVRRQARHEVAPLRRGGVAAFACGIDDDCRLRVGPR